MAAVIGPSVSASDFENLFEGSTVTCGNAGIEAVDECDYNFTTTTLKTDVGDLTLVYDGSTVTDGSHMAAPITFSAVSTPAFSDGAAPALVGATANASTNINLVMSEAVTAVTFGDLSGADWTATDITATGVALDGSGGIDVIVDPIAITGYSADDFAYNDSLNTAPSIEDAAGNLSAPFSGKTIMDGMGPGIGAGTLTADESACTGTGGICKIGDLITFSWDNSVATGDGNADVASVTGDLSAFGGSAAQPFYDDSTHGDTVAGDEIYTYDYTVVADDDDAPGSHFGLTATDTLGNSGTQLSSADTAPVDNIAPIISAAGNLTITLDNGTVGTAEIGDEVTYGAGTVSVGDGDSFTVNLSLLTGHAAASPGGSPYTVIPGIMNTSYAFTETVTDDAGNTTEGYVAAIDVDNATGTGFNAADLSLGALLVSESTYAHVTFDPALDLPVDGKILVTFPPGFDVSAVDTVSNTTALNGTFSIGVLGQTVTLTRNGDGTALLAGTTAGFRISPLINPTVAGVTGNFGFSTKDASDITLSSVSALPGVMITALVTTPTPITPNTTVVGGGGGGGGGGGSYYLNAVKDSGTDSGTGAEEEVLHASAQMCPLFYKPSVEPMERFNDTFGHWAEDYINTIAALGIVEGKTSSIYAPNDPISRAEILKITLNSFNYGIPEEISENPLPDVELNAWYAPFVKAAFENEIIYGFDTGLSPDTPASRGMVVTILAKAACFDDIQEHFTENYSSHPDYSYAALPDVPITAYYAPYVAYFYDHGIVDGYENGTFGPLNSITRAEVAKMVVNILEKFGIVSEVDETEAEEEITEDNTSEEEIVTEEVVPEGDAE